MTYREVHPAGVLPTPSSTPTVTISINSSVGSLSEVKSEEWGGSHATRGRVFVWRWADSELGLEELSLGAAELKGNAVRLAFEGARVLSGVTMARAQDGRLFLLIPTTTAVFRVPIRESSTEGASALSSLSQSQVLDPDNWAELACSSTPLTGAAFLRPSGEAVFGLGCANATLHVAALGRLRRAFTVPIAAPNLIGRFAGSFFGSAEGHDEQTTASGLVFQETQAGLRLVSLSKDGRLRLWSAKDGTEKRCLDLCTSLLQAPHSGQCGDERYELRSGKLEGRDVLLVSASSGSNTKIGVVSLDSSDGLRLESGVVGPLGDEFLRDLATTPTALLLLSHDASNAPSLHSTPLPLHLGRPWERLPLGAGHLREGAMDDCLSAGADAATLLSSPGLFSTGLLRRAASLVCPKALDLPAAVRDPAGARELWRVATQMRKEELEVICLLNCGGIDMSGLIRRSGLSLLTPTLSRFEEETPLDAETQSELLALLDQPYGPKTAATLCAAADRLPSRSRRRKWTAERMGCALDGLLIPLRLPTVWEADSVGSEPESPWLPLGRLGAGLIGSGVAQEASARLLAAMGLLVELGAGGPAASMEEVERREEASRTLWEAARALAFITRLADQEIEMDGKERRCLLPALLMAPSSQRSLQLALADRLGDGDASSWSVVSGALVGASLELLAPATLLRHILAPFLLDSGNPRRLLELCRELEGLGDEAQELLRRAFAGLAHFRLAEADPGAAELHLDALFQAFVEAETAYDDDVELASPLDSFSGAPVSRGAWWLGLGQLLANSTTASSPARLGPLLRTGLARLADGDPHGLSLKVLLFELHVAAAEWSRAVGLLSELGDEGELGNCLRRLVAARLNDDPDSLVRMDFASFTPDVVAIIEDRARSANIAASDQYAVLWKFHSARHDFRKAAEWMYELGRRLLREVESAEGCRRAATALTLAHQSLLAIADPLDRWILRAAPSASADAEPFVQVYGVEEIQVEKVSAQARFVLESESDSAADRACSDDELLTALVSSGLLDAALRLASAQPSRLDYKPILEALIDLWASSCERELGESERIDEMRLLELNRGCLGVSRGSRQADWWALVETFVRRMSELWTPSPVWSSAARRILARGHPLPFTFLAAYKRVDPAEALRRLLEYGFLAEAALLAAQLLAALTGKADPDEFGLCAADAACVPLGVIDQLLRLLRCSMDAAHHKPKEELEAHLKDYLRFSHAKSRSEEYHASRSSFAASKS